jgi:hypothetical protein
MAFSWQAAVYKKFSIRHGSGGTAKGKTSQFLVFLLPAGFRRREVEK